MVCIECGVDRPGVVHVVYLVEAGGIRIPHLVSRQPLPVAKHHELHLAIGSDLVLEISGLGVRCQRVSFQGFDMIGSTMRHP